MITSSASLVLCCAEEGEVRLVDLIDALHNEGHSPEVLSGIDAEATMLTSAVDRISGPALFVLCKTPELAPSAMRRLSGLFSARRGPQHRLMTVDIRAGHTADALRDVRAALAEAEADPGPGDDPSGNSGRLMRDVVGPTTFDALGVGARGPSIPEPSIDAEQLARELHEGMLEAEAAIAATSGARRRPAPAGPVYPRGDNLPAMGHVPEDEIERRTEPLEVTLERGTPARPARAPSRSPSPSASSSAPGIPQVVFDDRPLLGERAPADSLEASASGSARAGVPPVLEEDPSPPPSRRPVRSPSPRAEAPLRRPTPPSRTVEGIPREEPDDEPLPDEPTPSGLDLARPRVRSEPSASMSGVRPRGRMLLLLSAAGMLALLTMAVMHVTMGPEATADRGAPGASAGGVTPGAASGPAGSAVGRRAPDPAPSDAGGTAPDPTAGAPSPTSGAAAEPAAGRDDATAAAGDDDDDAAADEDTGAGARAGDDADADDDDADAEDDDAGDADAGDDGAGDDTAVPPVIPATPPAPAEDEALDVRLAADIADGSVEIVGHLYMLAKTPPRTTTWDEADALCRARRTSGVGGWRLPSKSQIRKLRKAGKLQSVSYWTSTTVGSDEVVAYDGGDGRTTVWLKIEPNARAVCVHKRK